MTRSIRRDSPSRRQQKESANSRVVASLDRKRLGADFWGGGGISIRGVRLQGSRKFADDTVHAAQTPEASYTEPTWQTRSVQRNPHRGNFTHWGHDFYTMFRASADGVATTSISPCWSVTSTRTASFRRSKNTSTEPLLV